jgi:hypothetical protein
MPASTAQYGNFQYGESQYAEIAVEAGDVTLLGGIKARAKVLVEAQARATVLVPVSARVTVITDAN